jgi:hypothetical protein
MDGRIGSSAVTAARGVCAGRVAAVGCAVVWPWASTGRNASAIPISNNWSGRVVLMGISASNRQKRKNDDSQY